MIMSPLGLLLFVATLVGNGHAQVVCQPARPTPSQCTCGTQANCQPQETCEPNSKCHSLTRVISLFRCFNLRIISFFCCHNEPHDAIFENTKITVKYSFFFGLEIGPLRAIKCSIVSTFYKIKGRRLVFGSETPPICYQF